MPNPDQHDNLAQTSAKAQTVWHDDEIGKVSTLSCRTVAAIRAVDAEDATVPYEEPLAAWLAGDDWLGRIRQIKQASDQYHKGLISDVSLRCIAIDAAVLDACHGSAGIKQVVLLGAGMDTRPYRLEIPDVAWFEVDVPAMSDLKQRLIEQVPEPLRPFTLLRVGRLERLPLDLARSLDALLPMLVARGFDANAPALCVMEGLVYYLSSDENRQLFHKLPAAPGSEALVTCIPAALKTMVNDPAVQEKMPHYRMIAPAWKTDLDTFRGTVGSRWAITQEVNLFDYAEHSGRALARDRDIALDHRDVAERYLVMNAT
ncbi:class I SAM-dependent methyltransferase [Halochromatium roseum]|uniref:class I SAM-dependent methyltransferase n=1 Tax=Halochromatium roseum TaxID=391920 RepID=UPI0019141926|nr:class I SAM-dependent methyltransferase [Halochromatium roseum]